MSLTSFWLKQKWKQGCDMIYADNILHSTERLLAKCVCLSISLIEVQTPEVMSKILPIAPSLLGLKHLSFHDDNIVIISWFDCKS